MSRRVTERIKAREAKNKPAPITAKLTYPEEVAASSKPDLDKPAKPKAKKLK